jgi:Na+/proline symporter/signal transduction histidine kinase
LRDWVLLLISVAYIALLFAVAVYGDSAARTRPPHANPWTYSLSLGVLVTSWTFYGAVGHAVASGWDYLTIYLGQILILVFGFRIIARTVRIGKRNNVTSLADFLGARYGRSRALAVLVTLISIVGLVPYMALQLKAIAISFGAMIPAHTSGLETDTALIMTLLLTTFAILFGARSVSSTENHAGLVLAIAFESVIKLVALTAVGLYAVYVRFNGFSDAFSSASPLLQMSRLPHDWTWQASFVAQTLLGMVALLCVPRQFHVTVVENRSLTDLRTARWIFPTYLVLSAALVLPIAAAGLRALPGAAPDLFVLALPLSAGHHFLALLVYLGGFSAASGMVIVESIALATMLSNEIVLPMLLRAPRFVHRDQLGAMIKLTRRIAIFFLLALAYCFCRAFTRPGSLASIGFLSFAAASQLAPLLLGGLYWRGASHAGALAGLGAGFITWSYTFLLPATLGIHGMPLLDAGPFGVGWLRPTALFGVSELDLLTRGTLWSLLANISAYVLVSRWMKPGLREQLRAARFLDPAEDLPPLNSRSSTGNVTVLDLVTLLERVFGTTRTQALLNEFSDAMQASILLQDKVGPELARHVERQLSGALGAASARSILALTLHGRDMHPEDVIRLLDDTSQVISFNRELLRASLEHLPQGVSVVDGEQRLVAWNQRYVAMFEFPQHLISAERPIEDIFRYNAGRGLLGHGPIEDLVQRRLDHLRAGRPYMHERALPDGTVLEIRGNPMPGGGFVTSYADVTVYKRAAEELRALADSLERRVHERTTALQEAKAQAERANRSKTRFVAAAIHDLQQPLNAARLFVAALQSRLHDESSLGLIASIESALSAEEQILNSLLDISRLEVGTLDVQPEEFRLDGLFEQLAREFTMIAGTKDLEFRWVRTHATVRTDQALLRRVLQNLLSNAMRYTNAGRVLLGTRRQGDRLRIEIWDTGSGIAESRHREIFEEFKRLDTARNSHDRGLGLGLAIVERIARLIHSEVRLRSWPGRGSVFSIDVPLGNPQALAAGIPPTRFSDDSVLQGRHIWCIDDDIQVTEATRALLERWGCSATTARDHQQAVKLAIESPAPDILLLDYRLRDITGPNLLASVGHHWSVPPDVILMSAESDLDLTQVARQAGWSFLKKPIRAPQLRALLTQLLVRRERF